MPPSANAAYSSQWTMPMQDLWIYVRTYTCTVAFFESSSEHPRFRPRGRCPRQKGLAYLGTGPEIASDRAR